MMKILTFRGVTALSGAALLAAVTLASRPAHAAPLAALTVKSGTAITPAAADTWYCAQSTGCTASGTRQLWATNYPLEITALANALHNNVDLIYEYVRNNVEIVPIYGLQKGALGALIDRSGTAFDQAQLMVELLRSAGYTANYIQGAVTLTGTQMQQWLGTNNAPALIAILADGGVPSTVTPTTGTATSVTLAHVWVQVNISGTTYLFDPAFKPHTFTTGLDIGVGSGWNEANFLASGQNTMVTGTQSAPSDVPPNSPVSIRYVRNVNSAGLQGQLTTYATALASYMKTHGSVAGQVYATQQWEDVVGRQDIQPSTTTIRQTSLSYAIASPTPHTWTGNIPDVYRTKITVEMMDLPRTTVRLAQTLFADEVYGRRVDYDTYLGANTWYDDTIQLRVDGVYVGSQYVGSDTPGARSGYVRLSVDHPYAASSGGYMDLIGTNALLKRVDFVSPVNIVIGFGEVSDRLQAKLGSEQVKDKLLPPSTYFTCGPGGCEAVDRPAQPGGESTLARAYAGWLAQYTRMATIQSRMRSSIHVQHHTLGVAFRESYMVVPSPQGCPGCWAVGEGALALDVDTAISINSKTAVANDRRTLARSLAAAADTLEASQFEQLADTAMPASVAHRFEWNTTQSASAKYFLVKQGGNSVSLFPSGPTPYFYLSIYGNVAPYTNAGYKAIVAENEFMGPGRDCFPTPCVLPQPIFRFERGGAFQAFAADGVTTAHIVTDQTGNGVKGGSAADPPNYDVNFTADKAADLLKDQFKDRSDDFGVNLASGEFTYSPGADLSVGLGEFPYKLSLERTFKSGESHSPGMGKGWSHNLDMRVNLTTNGAEAFGQSSPLGAANTLMALYATQQIYATEPTTDDTWLRRWVLVPFVQSWWAGKIRFNTVTYTAGSTTKTFVRMPDGTFNPPGGYNPADGSSYWKLLQTGTPAGYGLGSYGYAGVSFTLTSPSKDVQTFVYQGRLNRDQSQPHLYGRHHSWHITNWTFPQGVSLTFNYAPVDIVNYVDDHLVSVQNSLGRQINFSFAANSSWDNCNIQSVNDNQGRSATFDCLNNTVTSPASDVNKVTYGTINCGAGAWPDRTKRPMCSPFFMSAFGPSDTSFAKLALTYDSVGRVKTYADAVAVKTPASRNPYNFFITGGTRGERQDPSGFVYTVYYDPWTRAISFTDELNNTSWAQYDGLGRVSRRTSAENIITDFSYDPRGNVIQLKQTPKVTPYTVPANLTVGATYDTGCGKIKTVTDAKTNVTTWTYNATTCLVSQIQQPTVLNGVTGTNAVPTTNYTYTAVGLLDTITDPSGVAVKYTYDPSGNRTKAQVNPTGLNVFKDYGYDSVGNITSVTNGRGNATGFLYDAARRVTRVTSPAATCSITENIWAGGLVTKVRRAKICGPNFSTDTDWQVWRKSYTPTDKINVETDPDGGTVTTTYGPVDRSEYVTQSIGGGQAARVTRTQYDAAGQTFKIYKGWGSADQITYAEYAYTPDGRQASYKDANLNQTGLDYDGYGRLAKTTFPLGSLELYSYDNNGNLTLKTNRSGKTITMVFDALNRETTRTVQANAASNYARTLATNYDLASRKWDVTADGQTLRHRYDTAARLLQVQDSLLNALGGTIGNVDYAYDSASNRTSVNFSASQGTWAATYNYDTAERLATVVNGASTLAQFGYDPLSRMTSTAFLDSTSVGLAYEADDDLQTLTHNFTGGSLVQGYTHNGAHQISGMTTTDATYLMKQVGATTAYTPNSLNQYSQVGSSAINYDTNGNLTGDGSATYSYDEENRLRQVVTGGVTTVYAYDPLGRRRAKTVGSTTTYFVSGGANELAELSSTGTRLRFYLNANGMDNRIGMFDDSGATGWRFYHINHQGSTLFTTRQGTSGAIADQYQYGPFGEPLPTAPLTGNPFRYTGRYLDAESGLYCYRARFYSQKIGRFLQTDPIGVKDDLDLYTYVYNDPISKTDPTGTSGPSGPGNAATCTGSRTAGGCAMSLSPTAFQEAAHSAGTAATGTHVATAVVATAAVTAAAPAGAAVPLAAAKIGLEGLASKFTIAEGALGAATAVAQAANGEGKEASVTALSTTTRLGVVVSSMAVAQAVSPPPTDLVTVPVAGAAAGLTGERIDVMSRNAVNRAETDLSKISREIYSRFSPQGRIDAIINK
jgi:RHS repeat-associated protein